MKSFNFSAIVFSVLLLTQIAVQAQNNLPIIKATSRAVDVIDGDDFRKGAWGLLPEKKPDVYHVLIPHKPHRVMFRTDIDSIAFDTQYAGVYDFIIVLNNKDSCYTRILAMENNLLHFSSSRKSTEQKSDTIPMTIGRNDKIFIKASINNSAPLNFQFDLGAGGSIIKKGSVDKIKMDFDGKTFLINSDGRNEVPTSSKNTLVVGPMRWANNITLIVGDNMDRGEDGLLGNTLFQDKVIELNYDSSIMVIHDTMPEIGDKYTRHNIILDGGVVPFIQASIKVNGNLYTDWYMFDTGYFGYLRISSDLYKKHQLRDKVEKAFSLRGNKLILPGFEVGGHLFTNVNAVLEKAHQDGNSRGLIGNSLLKRFNVFLDNRNGYIYLKPNSLLYAPDKGNSLGGWTISIILLLIILLAGVWIIRKKMLK
ncbi:hypothetical protein DVR12_12900 [Chitinophaga silvatica]|uniref:Aspartyl protease n=1 Tax=Chitinophaga silvatica TaxID=2282649 RepID=A0A3E1YAK0_9BACT|nr:aspartyl protease family protein [Chitinophaga silvatica]RFS22687.1 hypothetical protein DVR12_12900 [Chitinophaga silvatica]